MSKTISGRVTEAEHWLSATAISKISSDSGSALEADGLGIDSEKI